MLPNTLDGTDCSTVVVHDHGLRRPGADDGALWSLPLDLHIDEVNLDDVPYLGAPCMEIPFLEVGT